MAISITLMPVLKRRNSTLIPKTGLKKIVEGFFVDGADIINPDITIKFPTSDKADSNPLSYNYMYIPELKRYYYVNNWTIHGEFWTAHCSCDVLATYRDVIGMSEQYVLRSSAKSNSQITDSMYPIKNQIETSQGTVSIVSSNSIWRDSVNYGCFLLRCITNGIYDVCGVANYILDFNQISEFMNFLLNDVSYADIEEISDGLTKALFNPMQYLVSCTWLPKVPKWAVNLSDNVLYYGWWNFKLNSGTLKFILPGLENNVKLASGYIPIHPDYDTKSDYLRKSPFTTATLFIEPWGSFEVPITVLNTGSFWIYADFDPVGGRAVLRLTTDEEGKNTFVYKVSDYGVPIQFSQITTDVRGFGLSLGANVATDVIGGFADKVFGGNISNAMSGIASAVEAAYSKAESNGTPGSFLAYFKTPYMVVKYARQTEKDTSRHGYPLCETTILSKIPGFIMCENPKFIGHSGTLLSEKIEVEKYMEQGFYYE